MVRMGRLQYQRNRFVRDIRYKAAFHQLRGPHGVVEGKNIGIGRNIIDLTDIRVFINNVHPASILSLGGLAGILECVAGFYGAVQICPTVVGQLLPLIAGSLVIGFRHGDGDGAAGVGVDKQRIVGFRGDYRAGFVIVSICNGRGDAAQRNGRITFVRFGACSQDAALDAHFGHRRPDYLDLVAIFGVISQAVV
ncbi:hypothetical protein SDC9_65147 [bioreactor metagenome]|uniref:Uncharacterized protein n=1 Tax=bioreactor metagenome TaxID=1076179 RepID=A0A644XXF3_9ZZZZ